MSISTDRIDINRVLMQMRSLQNEMKVNNPEALPNGLPNVGEVRKTEETSFGGLLKSAVDAANETSRTASGLARQFEAGVPGVDLPEVMIAMQKSSVSTTAMIQVRNKLVQAYKDIMSMPV